MINEANDTGDLPGSSRCAPEAASASSPSRVTIPIAGNLRLREPKQLKPVHDTLTLAARIGAMLRCVGFEHRYTSMHSEACYYGWPGRSEVLRLATHKQAGKMPRINGAKIVAKITLCGTRFNRAGQMNMGEHKIEIVLGKAIGEYFIRAAQGIEAGTAETHSGSVHDSPVGNADAPVSSGPDQTGETG